jgi:hypothetical protein
MANFALNVTDEGLSETPADHGLGMTTVSARQYRCQLRGFLDA